MKFSITHTAATDTRPAHLVVQGIVGGRTLTLRVSSVRNMSNRNNQIRAAFEFMRAYAVDMTGSLVNMHNSSDVSIWIMRNEKYDFLPLSD